MAGATTVPPAHCEIFAVPVLSTRFTSALPVLPSLIVWRDALVDDLHGADLGGASHGAAGEGGPQAVGNGGIGSPQASHRADQLVHSCVALQVHQAWHMHSAHLCAQREDVTMCPRLASVGDLMLHACRQVNR